MNVCFRSKAPDGVSSFIKLHSLITPRATTEFSYRYSSETSAFVILSFFLLSSPSAASGPTPAARAQELAQITKALADEGMEALDLSENEFAKSHVRHMVGGRSGVKDERVIRFGESHESVGADIALQNSPNVQVRSVNSWPACSRTGTSPCSITGITGPVSFCLLIISRLVQLTTSDVGKVLVGVQVPAAASAEFDQFLVDLGYPWAEETDNAAYKQFLQV